MCLNSMNILLTVKKTGVTGFIHCMPVIQWCPCCTWQPFKFIYTLYLCFTSSSTSSSSFSSSFCWVDILCHRLGDVSDWRPGVLGGGQWPQAPHERAQPVCHQLHHLWARHQCPSIRSLSRHHHLQVNKCTTLLLHVRYCSYTRSHRAVFIRPFLYCLIFPVIYSKLFGEHFHTYRECVHS